MEVMEMVWRVIVGIVPVRWLLDKVLMFWGMNENVEMVAVFFFLRLTNKINSVKPSIVSE